MNAYNSEVNGFIELHKDSIASAWTALSALPTLEVDEHFKESHPATMPCAAVAVFPNGKREVLTLDKTVDANNWLNADPQPSYILSKGIDGSCGLIITDESLGPLGKGAGGSIYRAAKFPIRNGSISLNESKAVVVKAAAIGHETTLAHEVKFKTADVVPHGAEGERIFAVGKISFAIFDYVPGQKLVQEIQLDGIKIAEVLLELTFAERCQLAIDLSSKLQAMHAAKVCHLDLNWDNVLVEIEDGQYKTCHIIDHGQSQLSGTSFNGILIGKFFWNAKEANDLRAGLVQARTLVANPKIDIVPLGVMCDIIFAATKDASEQDCNPFIAKQIAFKAAGDFQRNQAKAIGHTPFGMGKNFIDKKSWKLQIATADRVNELMQVFFERMVSDIPEERPTAEEVNEFFIKIKKLSQLSNNIRLQKPILSRCDEIVYQKNKIEKEIKGDKKNASSAMIIVLQRILSGEHYLKSQAKPTKFLVEKIKQLILLEEKEKHPNKHALFMLGELLAYMKSLDPKKIDGVGVAVSAMQMILLANGKQQFLAEIAAKFGCADFKSLKKDIAASGLTVEERQKLDSVSDDELIELNKLNEDPNAFQQQKYILDSEDSTEDEKKKASRLLSILELMKKQDEIDGKKLCLSRYKEIALKYKTEESKIAKLMGMNAGEGQSGEAPFNPFSSFLSVLATDKGGSPDSGSDEEKSEPEDLMGSFSSLESFSEGDNKDDCLKELDNKREATLLEDKKDKNLLTTVPEPTETKILRDENEYKTALDQYKLALKNYETLRNRLAVGQPDSLVNNDMPDSVIKTGQDLVHAATFSGRNKKNHKALTTVIHYNCTILVTCTELMNNALENREPVEPVKSNSQPSEDEYRVALQKLEKSGEKETAAKALKALGVICAVAAAVTLSVVIVGAVCIAYPPMLVALPFLKPVATSVMAAPVLAAVSPAIMTLGAGLSFGIRELIHRDGKNVVKSAESAQKATEWKCAFFSNKDSSNKSQAAVTSVAPRIVYK